ncbi:hypothetical protein GGI25_003330 [Coemansia spiralis]|uniref:P-loop containing nucleoside triphosphate hydrolase protein n=2 Tax=Coemansia TaxID=4863 RepID=A0A9W8KY95_9FUNG|nr:hypothetical protein EDC05_002566 [Coemansia umbellata]KAJ2677110.1 hypothetical protein GGI25_003330 [Coemansia spiralis]
MGLLHSVSSIGLKLGLLLIALRTIYVEATAIRRLARSDLCPTTPSLFNDCFRLGVAWPLVNLILSLFLFANLLIVPCDTARRSTTDEATPLLRDRAAEPSPEIFKYHDNRLRTAVAAVAASLVAIGNPLVFLHGSAPEYHRAYWRSHMWFWTTVLLVFVRDLRNHLQRPRRVFHWSLVLVVLLQLVLSMLFEGYYAFFTDIMLTAHSRFVAVSILVSFAIALLPLCVDREGFYLPLKRRSELGPEYEPSTESREYQTPLARLRPLEEPLAVSPESKHSVLGQLTFSWVTPILRLGTRVAIDSADLYHLDRADRPLAIWRRYTTSRRPTRSLLTTLVVTFSPQLLSQALLALVGAVLSYAAPFFLQRILRSIRLHTKDTPLRMIYLDSLGLLISSLLHSLASNRVLWLGRKVSMRLQSLLVAELSSKALCRRSKSSVADAKDKTAASDGRVANMLTSDLESVGHISSYLDEIYTLPIGFVLGSWYLYSLLGTPALIGLTITVIYYPLTKLMVKYLIKYQRRLMALDDERVTMITEMFQGIRAVKLFGWQSRFIKKVRDKRDEEISAYWTLMFLQLPVSFVRSLTTSLILVAILAIYTLGYGHTLTPDVVFPSITVFSMVSATFNGIPGLFRWMSGCYVSLTRIESFMVQSQVQELADRVAVNQECEVGFDDATLVWDINSADNKSESLALDTPTGTASPRKASTASLDNLSELSEQTPLVSADSRGDTVISDMETTGAQTPLVQDELVQADVNMKGFTLSNITLRFPTGGLSVIVGPTGSGKSSLLSALIGEMTLTAGRVILPTADTQCSGQYHEVVELSGQKLVMTDIAYVAQEAWLRNATIRENILFGEPYQKDRYEEVLRVCALKPDLRILKAGDMTEIGERGVTLSGGQKQRVALARAVYSSRRILLIDDCLSAVDAHTGKHILNSCLLGQTHLMIGRTRVLVTHHVGCLPHCDFVAVIKDGCVAMSGSPEHIMRMGYNFSAELEKDTSHGHEGPPKTTDAADADGSGSVNDMKAEDEYNAARLEELAAQRGIAPVNTSELEGMLVEDEEREQGYVRPEIWLDYMRMCGPWWYWATVVFFTFVGRFASIAQDYWVRLWMSSDTHTVAYWLLTYVLVGMLNTAVRLAAMINENTGALRAGREYHERLFTRVMHATPRFFDKTPIGRVISRFSRDMRTIDDSIISYISVLLAQITQVGSVFVIISMVVPRFILIAILMTIMYAMLAIYYLNATRELKRLDSISMAPLLSLFSELITGVESIRAFGAQNQYTMEAMRRVDLHNRPYYLMWAANRWLCTRIEFSGCIVSFSTTVLILLGLDRIDAGLAGFVLMYAISFSDYMLWFIRNYSECEISMNAVERVNQYLVLEQEAAAFVDDGPTGWPRSGSVEVDNLVVEYVPGSPVLHNISFNVAHGEKIGVVGRTGAGKSTLSLAFLRFVEASGGCILVDGVDIAKVGLEELRRSITIIPQDPVLFNGTIKFNLDPFGEFPDELLWDALKRSHLTSAQMSEQLEAEAERAQMAASGSKQDADGSISRMSGIFTSLDAEIKENGQNLSLGQRQLVALARALVRRSRLIIMDEATASVDFDTDDRIQRTIRGSEFANSTLFCIAHRLRTIIDYDRVLVLDKGKIVEFDTPWNLLQRDSGVFRSMCEKTGEFEYLFGMAKSKC